MPWALLPSLADRAVSVAPSAALWLRNARHAEQDTPQSERLRNTGRPREHTPQSERLRNTAGRGGTPRSRRRGHGPTWRPWQAERRVPSPAPGVSSASDAARPGGTVDLKPRSLEGAAPASTGQSARQPSSARHRSIAAHALSRRQRPFLRFRTGGWPPHGRTAESDFERPPRLVVLGPPRRAGPGSSGRRTRGAMAAMLSIGTQAIIGRHPGAGRRRPAADGLAPQPSPARPARAGKSPLPCPGRGRRSQP